MNFFTRITLRSRRFVVLVLTLTGLIGGTLGAATIGAGSASAAPYGSGHGLCFDINSRLAQSSLSKIGRDANGGTWSPHSASNNLLSKGCGLDWMLVTGNGIGDATYQSRVLLFKYGRFLGTVDHRPYSYTSISRYNKYSVTVSYRWLKPSDAFCCATGGPTYVTAIAAGDHIVRLGTFPPAS